MYIFLDESGDLGFDFTKKGTPRYFIITLLVCDDKNTVNQLNKAVTRVLKNKLPKKVKKTNELKGTTTSITIKHYFYRYLSALKSWRIYSIVLDKHKLYDMVEFLPREERLYNFVAKEILRQVNFNSLSNSLYLLVDKRKGRKGINEFNKYLTYHVEALLPLDIIFGITHDHSHNNPALQATDLFCWGIHRQFECNDSEWFNCFRDRATIIEIDKVTGIKKDGP